MNTEEEARRLTTLALSQTLRTAAREALCSDPDNPLAIALQEIIPDNEEELSSFYNSLQDYSVAQLENMVRLAPPSYLRFRIVRVIEHKEEEGTL